MQDLNLKVAGGGVRGQVPHQPVIVRDCRIVTETAREPLPPAHNPFAVRKCQETACRRQTSPSLNSMVEWFSLPTPGPLIVCGGASTSNSGRASGP
jgi:hypothetical protein